MNVICFCAAGCALNSLADPGVFGNDCNCWCHDKDRRASADQGTKGGAA